VYEVSRAWLLAHPEAVERYNAARRAEYAAARGSMTRVCANPDCARAGEPFEARRVDQRSCSPACRDHLAYLRRPGRA
jgi:hypothetical protein